MSCTSAEPSSFNFARVAPQAEKEREAAKQHEDRKKMELDHAAALKQVQVEREDARRKIDTERARCALCL